MRRLMCRWFGHHTIVFLSPFGGIGAACLRCYDITRNTTAALTEEES